jgi:nucleoside-diphosphate-sugar epimerase
MNEKVLVTGGSGFIGSRLIKKLVDLDYQVTAILRKTSKREHLPLDDIDVVEIDLLDYHGILDYFTLHRFDYVIHTAGITKALKKEDYYIHNTKITKHLIDALLKISWKPQKFIFISSQASHGTYKALQRPIKITDIQNPLTTYGKSKLLAERYIEEHYHNPFVIIKPTSVYGPRDKDFLIVMKLISKGFEGYIGTEPQKLSFIYVDDLVNAIISTIALPYTGEFLLSDGKKYIDEDLGRYIKKALGKKTSEFTNWIYFKFRGVATKYLQNYTMWYVVMGKYLTGKTVSNTGRMLNLASSDRWAWYRYRELVNITYVN